MHFPWALAPAGLRSVRHGTGSRPRRGFPHLISDRDPAVSELFQQAARRSLNNPGFPRAGARERHSAHRLGLGFPLRLGLWIRPQPDLVSQLPGAC